MTGAMTSPAMRRWEISGEKFWQYEVKGGELLCEWGKIGGSGKQRSHKNFASEDLAKTEGFYLTTPDAVVRRQTADYLVRLAEATRELGGSLMVLGSPKQRDLLPGVTYEQARLSSGGFDKLEPEDIRFHQINAYAVARSALDLIEASIGRQVHWAFGP